MTTLKPIVQPEYLTCAETARLVRAALKRQFPTMKFSVRSRTYAGGASIDVRWADGPTVRSVEAVTEKFAGGRFDGMIDLGYNVTHWLTKDGKATLAHDPGTVSSAGVNPERTNPLPPTPTARLVHMGADYIFCRRELTDQATLYPEAQRLADEYGWGPITAHRILSALDFLVGDTLQDAFRKVVENRD